MVLSLVACGSNAGNTTATQPNVPEADDPATTTPAEVTQNVTDLKADLSAIPEAAAYKEEIIIAENSAITSLDPHGHGGVFRGGQTSGGAEHCGGRDCTGFGDSQGIPGFRERGPVSAAE